MKRHLALIRRQLARIINAPADWKMWKFSAGISGMWLFIAGFEVGIGRYLTGVTEAILAVVFVIEARKLWLLDRRYEAMTDELVIMASMWRQGSSAIEAAVQAGNMQAVESFAQTLGMMLDAFWLKHEDVPVGMAVTHDEA